MSNYVRLGHIVKTFGLEGQLRCFSLTDFAKERFKLGMVYSLYDEKNDKRYPATLKSVRLSGDSFFLGFEEIHNISEAEAYLGFFVEMERELAPLPKGFYRLEDLKGCTVNDENGNPLGQVVDVLSYAPVKTLKVAREKQAPFYVPFVQDEFILAVDIAKKSIQIKLMPGLL